MKTIHSSRNDDARNIEGRLGIERRDRLDQIRTRLKTAALALAEAAELANNR